MTTYNIPNKILITSDDSIIEYQRTIPKGHLNKEILYEYKFIKSLSNKNFSKQDLIFTMTEFVLQYNLRNFFKEIKNDENYQNFKI